MTEKKLRILVAPLNWGLGHATRCIPVIRALVATGYEPVIASDGAALEMLKKEFPMFKALELPGYDITYPENGKDFKWKMFKNMPKMIDAVLAEKKIVRKMIKEHGISGIISDNRFGVQSKKVPSIFITHQLNVLSGNTTWLSGKLHRMIIEKFDECWVPDVESVPNLSGKLGHVRNPGDNIRYIGPLSRFEKKELPVKYDLCVVISGPEPQRTIFELQLQNELLQYSGNCVMIRGVVEEKQVREQRGNILTYNFMTSAELEKTLNESALLISRSGYTTIMDVAKLGKKAFFIPTPGQFEQEYLARKMKKDGLLPSAKQEKFRLENLLEADLYPGLPFPKSEIHWKNLFCLFEGEREFRT